MSEFVRFDEQGEPYFHFDCKMGSLYGDHNNSIIYHHQFQDRGVDHYFVEIEPVDESYVTGAYLFRAEVDDKNPGIFDKIIGELNETGWPAIYSDTVAQCDQDAFDRMVEGKLTKVTNKKIKAWLGE